MRKVISCLITFLVFSIMAKAQTSDLFDKLLFSFKKDTLPYRLLKPVNPGAKQLFPLVVFLHGAGERGNDNEAQIKHISNLFLDPINRGKYPCYVLAPQCPKGQMWADFSGKKSFGKEPTKPTGLLVELLKKINKEYPIDTTRIYITGVSMGGFGAWDLIARFPGKFAAAVPICGGGDEQTASKIKHLPIWVFHGAKDEVVSPQHSRNMVKALQNAGGVPGYTEYPDVEHASWILAYQEPHLLPWLFKQKSGNPPIE